MQRQKDIIKQHIHCHMSSPFIGQTVSLNRSFVNKTKIRDQFELLTRRCKLADPRKYSFGKKKREKEAQISSVLAILQDVFLVN